MRFLVTSFSCARSLSSQVLPTGSIKSFFAIAQWWSASFFPPDETEPASPLLKPSAIFQVGLSLIRVSKDSVRCQFSCLVQLTKCQAISMGDGMQMHVTVTDFLLFLSGCEG